MSRRPTPWRRKTPEPQAPPVASQAQDLQRHRTNQCKCTRVSYTELFGQFRIQLLNILRFALPHNYHSPPLAAQQAVVFQVTAHFVTDLLAPEPRVRLRPRSAFGALVTAPVAAINKDHRPPAPEYDIGPPRQIARNQAEAKAEPVKGRSNDLLRSTLSGFPGR